MWKVYHLIKVSLSAAVAGIICCIGPVILFQFGLITGVYAISFADFFYAEDGSIGVGSIILRIIALLIIILGIVSFNKKESCSLNTEKEKKTNKILFVIIVILISFCLFHSLDEFSSFYFDKYIVPQQQIELNLN
ncbi:MAG: hypothetical protein CMC79_00290 [Flavobacteriaceae bacterium]|nr:hypothetical protein [Flavobacteriaceae bacterium]|tara:strand:+ start:30964 stop:31368 length:405 start_codon:yes stop_codon:yes gene_type:complete